MKECRPIRLNLRHPTLFLSYAILVFVAFFHPLDPSVVTSLQTGTGVSFWVSMLFLLAWLAPTIPLTLAGLQLVGMRSITARLASVLAVVTVAVGLFLTLASTVFSLGSDTQLLRGTSLTIAIASSFLFWAKGEGGASTSNWAKLGLSLAALAALWSVLTIPMIKIQSRIIADGSPYCIAHHDQNSPVQALAELRGFSFYTEATGHKSTSRWYFHGLLIVNHPEEQRVYNWSPRRWRFDPIERPDLFIQPLRNACIPA